MIKRNKDTQNNLLNVAIFFIIIICLLILPWSSSGHSFIILTDDIKNENISQNPGAELQILTDKKFYKVGEMVSIFLKNIGDELLSAGGPIVTIYDYKNEIVYQEAAYCWYELEPGDYVEWPAWDQTDQNGYQVRTGEYRIEGFLSGFETDYVDNETFHIYNKLFSLSGPTDGAIDIQYLFCIDLPDVPECAPYYLMWDFNDGTQTYWDGPYSTNTIVCRAHTFLLPGVYNIKTKIRQGCQPDFWTDSLTVNIYNNHVPDAPIIKGPSNPKAGQEYHYKIYTKDTDEDYVSYFIDLGDGVTINWTECKPSNEILHVYHQWSAGGTYTITAKARDCPWYSEGPESSLSINVAKGRSNYYEFSELLDRFSSLFPLISTFIQKFIS